jgi:hypothetical protein
VKARPINNSNRGETTIGTMIIGINIGITVTMISDCFTTMTLGKKFLKDAYRFTKHER